KAGNVQPSKATRTATAALTGSSTQQARAYGLAHLAAALWGGIAALRQDSPGQQYYASAAIIQISSPISPRRAAPLLLRVVIWSAGSYTRVGDRIARILYGGRRLRARAGPPASRAASLGTRLRRLPRRGPRMRALRGGSRAIRPGRVSRRPRRRLSRRARARPSLASGSGPAPAERALRV